MKHFPLLELTYCRWRWTKSALTTRRLATVAAVAKNDRAPSPSAVAASLHAVVGLEIHAQIAAKSKLFSGAEATFAGRVNSCVAPLDAAIPGTLPVINRRCVEAAVLAALALDCRINPVSTFDRKHYFYADMPAGYQITQHFDPIARDGSLDYPLTRRGEEGEEEEETVERRARILQIQIEQDSGKSIHDAANGVSLIDLNRAGQGLLEIVTAPDFNDSLEATSFAAELRLLLLSLGVCVGNMSRGHFRIDANVSVHRPGEPLGVRTEIKNLNSLKSARRAIDYEIDRQKTLVSSGGQVDNETLGFDADSGKTVSMRDKEVVTDYRFLPEPNLPPLRLSSSARPIPGAVNVDDLASRMPESPKNFRRRLEETWRLTRRQSASLFVEEMAEFFERVAEHLEKICPERMSAPTRTRVSIPPSPKPCPPNHAQYWRFLFPSQSLSVTQRAADILLRNVSALLERREKDAPSSDSPTIESLGLTPVFIAELTVLLEEGRLSPVLIDAVLDAYLSPDSASSSANYLVDDIDLRMISDEAEIRSLVVASLSADAAARKELAKDNPKKNSRAAMKVLAGVMEASRKRVDPVILKRVVDEEVAKFKEETKTKKK